VLSRWDLGTARACQFRRTFKSIKQKKKLKLDKKGRETRQKKEGKLDKKKEER